MNFKIDNIVSVSLPRYGRGRKLGIITDVIEGRPRGKGELMWGIPWEGPYPLVGVYVRSIVGINGSSEDGYYYFTAKEIDDGTIKHTKKKLHPPLNKFNVGDKVAIKNHYTNILEGEVKSIPTLKDAKYSILWKKNCNLEDKMLENDLVSLTEAQAEHERIKTFCSSNKDHITYLLKNIALNVKQLTDLHTDGGVQLDQFLELNHSVMKTTQKDIEDFCNLFSTNDY